MSGAVEAGKVLGKQYGSGTSGATVKNGRGRVWGLTVTAGTTACTVTLRDGGASGTVVWKGVFVVTTAGEMPVDVDLHGLSFDTSIYITMTHHTQVAVVYS